MPLMCGTCSSPYQQKQQKELLNQLKQNKTINGTENKCGSQLFDQNLKKETNGNNEQDLTLLIQSSQKQKINGLKDEERVQEYNGGQTMQMSTNQMNQSSSKQNRIKEFMDFTQSTPEQAEQYLKQNKYDVEKALEQYFDQVEQKQIQNQNKQLYQTRQTQYVVQRQTQVENRSAQQSKEQKQNQQHLLQAQKFMEITGMLEQQQENTKQSIINQKQLSNAVSQEYSQMDITQQKEEINPQKKSENTAGPAGPDFQHLLKQNNHCQNSSAQNLNPVFAQKNGFSNQIFNSSNTFQTSNVNSNLVIKFRNHNISNQFHLILSKRNNHLRIFHQFLKLTSLIRMRLTIIKIISFQLRIQYLTLLILILFKIKTTLSNQNSGFALITNAAQFASSAFNPSNTFNPTQNPQNFNKNISFTNSLPQSTKINIITLKAEHIKQFTAQIIEFLNKYVQNATVKTNQCGDLNIYTNEREIETVIQVVRKIVVEEEQIPFTVVVV
ncbi:UBA-like_superfamily [Hexamita inflata]|uniref:UBA-like superfamily n=1 Tax=Hexamita inflata TaxID=28002 RepID=A0AA86ND27_9EUKA|nr:UBA-like superfamily [Hexamita inflata]